MLNPKANTPSEQNTYPCPNKSHCLTIPNCREHYPATHFNPHNPRRIITNDQPFNSIITFSCKSFPFTVGAKAKGNNLPTIKPMQFMKPCTFLILPLMFHHSSILDHLITCSQCFKMASHACMT